MANHIANLAIKCLGWMPLYRRGVFHGRVKEWCRWLSRLQPALCRLVKSRAAWRPSCQHLFPQLGLARLQPYHVPLAALLEPQVLSRMPSSDCGGEQPCNPARCDRRNLTACQTDLVSEPPHTVLLRPHGGHHDDSGRRQGKLRGCRDQEISMLVVTITKTLSVRFGWDPRDMHLGGAVGVDTAMPDMSAI